MKTYTERQAERRLQAAQEIAPHAYVALGKSCKGMVTILKDSEPAVAFSTGFMSGGKFMPIDVFRRQYAWQLTKVLKARAIDEAGRQQYVACMTAQCS